MEAGRRGGGYSGDGTLLVRRVRLGLALAMAGSVAFAALDLLLRVPHRSWLLGLEAGTAGLAGLALLALGRCPSRRRALAVALAALAVLFGSTVASASVAGDAATTPILAACICMATAVLLPWGVWPQVATVLLAGGAVGLSSWLARSELSALSAYAALAVAGSLAVSVYLAHELDRYRRALAREAAHAREEAGVATTLASVARDLIPALGTPELLARLCRRTTEVLGCDCSHTFLFDQGSFAPVAQYGHPREHWESMQLLRVPAGAVTAFLRKLERDEAVEWLTGEGQDDPVAHLTAGYGIRRTLAVPLRRDGRLFGMHTASYRSATSSFSPVQRRIAIGLGQIASLALENARLVERLEQADRLKSDLLSSMSHELRTPIHVILGYHELLLDGVFGDLNPEQRETLRRADLSARGLLELINATLDLSRYADRRIPLEIREVSITELTDEVARENPPPPDRRRLRVVWDVPADLPPLRTDPVKLKMALKNLVDNAIKFTPEGEVRVSVRPEGDVVVFEVRDTGIGMAREALPVIFEPFRQADSEHARRYGGIGLGLFLVRRIVDVLGGTITVESEPGRGSVFRMGLPRSGPPDRRDRQERGADAPGGERRGNGKGGRRAASG